MSLEISKEEMKKVLGIGEDALYYLRETDYYLRSASKWGIADMLLGGLIWGSSKRENIKKASERFEYAKENLQLFCERLNQVKINVDFDVNVSEGLLLADYFLDGVVENVLVQQKIKKARVQLATVRGQVEAVFIELEKQYEQLFAVEYVKGYF